MISPAIGMEITLFKRYFNIALYFRGSILSMYYLVWLTRLEASRTLVDMSTSLLRMDLSSFHSSRAIIVIQVTEEVVILVLREMIQSFSIMRNKRCRICLMNSLTTIIVMSSRISFSRSISSKHSSSSNSLSISSSSSRYMDRAIVKIR